MRSPHGISSENHTQAIRKTLAIKWICILSALHRITLRAPWTWHATLYLWQYLITQPSWYILGLCKDTNQLVLSSTIREPGSSSVFVFVVSSKQLIMICSWGIILVPYSNPTQTCTLCIWYLQHSSYQVGSLIALLVRVSWGWKVPPQNYHRTRNAHWA